MKNKNESTLSVINSETLPEQNAHRAGGFPEDANDVGFTRDGTDFVDEVNGPGGKLAPKFQPTYHELIVLAEYWLTTNWDTNFYCFTVNQTGSTNCRLEIYSARRFERLVDILGQAAYEEIVQRVDKVFCDRFGAEAWQEYRKEK